MTSFTPHMPTDSLTEYQKIQHAIQALEAQREILGEAVVETALAPLRAKLAALETITAAATRPSTESRAARRQATVLFADVSGFTAMSSQMDAEDVTERINAVWQRIDRVIHDHGGRIDKHIGDAVMAVWGVDSAREDDPERAIRAALAMQTELDDFNRDIAAPVTLSATALNIRVGIHTGLIVWSRIETTGETTAIGDTVNLASRLEHAAPIGSVLISHATYRHVRGVFDVQPQPPITVKGKDEPINTYIVHRAKPRPFRVLTRGVEGVETRMIGRESELRTLQILFNRAMDERQIQIVTLSAEAGVGKSRLLYEFENWIELQATQVTYFKGRAIPETEHTPYGLWRDLFRLRFNIADSDPASTVLEKFRSGMSPFLPPERADVVGHFVGFDLSSSPAVEALLGSQNFGRLALAYLVNYFKAVSTDEVKPAEPTVIFLEDIHWADDSSLDLIETLAREITNGRLLIVCPARPILSERRPNWAAAPPHTRIHLNPLSSEQSAALVLEILQYADSVPEDLREIIVRGAEGNPYYVEELVKMLIDDDIISVTARGSESRAFSDEFQPRWEIDLSRLHTLRVPSTLTGVLQARLDGLPEEERELLQRAAVVGRQFWDMAVAELHAEDDRDLNVTAGLTASQRRELIYHRDLSAFSNAEEYFFKHALLRDVTYETVLLKLRRVYHAQIAGWIEANAGERIGEYLTVIARHYELADMPSQAADYLRRAGEESFKVSSLRDALSSFERALSLTPAEKPELRAYLLMYIGRCEERLSQFPLAATHLGEALKLAREAQSRALEVSIYNYLGLVSLRQGQRAEAATFGQEAMMAAREINDAHILATAQTLLASSEAMSGNYERAIQLNQEALEVRQKLNQRHEMAMNLNNLGAIASIRGDFNAARSYLEECLRICRESGDRYMTVITLGNLASLLTETGDAATAKAYALESLQIRREINDRYGQAMAHSSLGLIEYHLDNFDAAQQHYEESLQIRQQLNDRPGIARTLANMGTSALDQKRYEDARRYFEESLAIARELGDRRNIAIALNNLADLAAVQHDLTNARTLLRDGLNESLAMKVQPVVLHALVIYAKTLVRSGHAERGIRLLRVVNNHPATLNETKIKHISPELASLRDAHSDAIHDETPGQEYALDYETLVTQVLADLSASAEL